MIILLQSYEKRTRDHPLEDMPEVQKGMKLILDIYQLLLSADASCIIGRRMVSFLSSFPFLLVLNKPAFVPEYNFDHNTEKFASAYL